jgi:hypothetical protein
MNLYDFRSVLEFFLLQYTKTQIRRGQKGVNLNGF